MRYLSPLKLSEPASAEGLLKKHASRIRPPASMATHLHAVSDPQLLKLAVALRWRKHSGTHTRSRSTGFSHASLQKV